MNTERNYVFIATTELHFLRTCLNVSLYACKFTSTVDSKPGVEKVRTQGVILQKSGIDTFNLIKFSFGIGWIQWCNTVCV